MLKSNTIAIEDNNTRNYDSLVTSDKLFRSCQQLRNDQKFTLDMLKKMRIEEALLIKAKSCKKMKTVVNPFCSKNLIVKKAIDYEGKEYDMENYKRSKRFFYENQMKNNAGNRFKATNKLNMFDEFERKEYDRDLKLKIKKSQREQSKAQDLNNFMSTEESQIKSIIGKAKDKPNSLGSRICMCLRKR